MTPIASFELGTRIPGRLVLVDFDADIAGLVAPAHAIEDKKLRLRTKKCCIAQTRRFEIGLCTLANGTRIAVIGLAIAGLDHVAGHDQRRFFKERIDIGRTGIGNQLHVRRFDALPAGDRRTIKRMARSKFFFIKVRYGHRGVVLFATGIGEAEVDKLDLVFLHHLHHVCNGLGHPNLLGNHC